ncbi:uncharacterized protein LOC105696617 [Orussus abietinus]|uniref:uncharacterized protein LOC105696617 n=1 Tax=Orussus abietinus TaxID=222816 RepID=UPI0006252BEB|nr:uncharacterized protein LOC105696617 [Orussus abietinus]
MDGGATEGSRGGPSESLGGLEDLENLEGWWTTSGIVVWSGVLLGSFLLNTTLLLAFLKRPGLRTISNRFVMNLTVSNLLTCAVLSPLLMVDAPSSRSLCAISEGATALVTTSSVLSVLLIAVDQYFAVVDPLRYRTRIDKLKCGVLIGSIWVIALIFGFLAGLNPHPRSLWLSCSAENDSIAIDDVQTRIDVFRRSNWTAGTVFEEPHLKFQNISKFPGEDLLEEFPVLGDEPRPSWWEYLSYGLVYTLSYGLLVYLVPFAGVCWTYVRIYSAARRNSERTRRTGSRPILSSGSLCEEYCPVRQDVVGEEFRRIPKISSLSSIEESIETSPSQMPRRCSDLILSTRKPMEDSGNVVFTLGCGKVDGTSERSKDVSRVPISVLKTEFLDRKEDRTPQDDRIRSRFLDRPDERRKSSHDLMYEESILARRGSGKSGLSDSSSEDSSQEDDTSATYKGNHENLDGIDLRCFDSREERADEDLPRPSGRDLPQNIDIKDPETILDDSPGSDPDLCAHPHKFEVEGGNGTEDCTSICPRLPRSLRMPGSGNKPYLGCPSLSKTGCRVGNGVHQRVECSFDVEDAVGKIHQGIAFTKTDSSNSLFGTGPNTPVVTITPPNKLPLHRASSTRSTSSYINSLKYRISNASLFKYREETRAARISALVIVMGLFCWTPYVVMLILRNLPVYPEEQAPPHKYDVIALGLLILAAYVSPLLFGYRSRRVKRELRKIFCFRKELSYKNNRSLMAKKVLKRRHSGGTFNQFDVDTKYNIFNCVYGKTRWPKEKVQFVQVPDTALAVETCRSSFSSGASTQISTTSTEEC